MKGAHGWHSVPTRLAARHPFTCHPPCDCRRSPCPLPPLRLRLLRSHRLHLTEQFSVPRRDQEVRDISVNTTWPSTRGSHCILLDAPCAQFSPNSGTYQYLS